MLEKRNNRETKQMNNSRVRRKKLLKKNYLVIRNALLSPFLVFRSTVHPDKNDLRNILFLRHDRVGDMVLSTPVFKALKRSFPAARLTVLASEANKAIIENNPNVDEIIVYEGIRSFMWNSRSMAYDLAVDLFFAYDFKQAFMTYISGAKYRAGFEISGRELFFNVKGPALMPVKNMAEHMLDLAGAVGANKEGCEPEIFLSNRETAEADRLISARGLEESIKIAVHPGAHYPSQRWPAEKFGEVIKAIYDEYGVKVLFFSARGEEHLTEQVCGAAEGKAEVFSGLGLRQFIAVLSRCDLLICNNSGPLHIASALKIPTISVMGPSAYPLWLPHGRNHIVIRKDVPCISCGRAECEDHSCMKRITVEEVMEAVKLRIKKIRNG